MSDFDTQFSAWLSEVVGMSPAFVAALEQDDDWTFVVKMHGVLEAALNHLLLCEMHNPDFEKVIVRLDAGNDEQGKLAFIKAGKLLSADSCLFVKMFGKLRNAAVHNFRNFDLNLRKHLDACDTNQKGNGMTALTSWCVEIDSEETRRSLRETAFRNPRPAIHNSCMRIIIASLGRQQAMLAHQYLHELILKQLAEKHEGAVEPQESTPTEGK
jgi:hypothetical protein